MEQLVQAHTEVESPSAPWWKSALWRARLALWVIAIVTFTWEQLSSPATIAFGNTASNAQWVRQHAASAYEDCLERSLFVAPAIACALLVLSIASSVRKQWKSAVLDLCALAAALAWGAVSLATLVLSTS